MSQKVTIDGKTTWQYPRTPNCVFAGMAVFGLSFFVGLIYGATTQSGWYIAVFIIGAVFGLLFASFGISQFGSVHIVFDDNDESIYLENALCCYRKVSKEVIGPYAGFEECILHEKWSTDGDDLRKKVYSIHFVYTDGPKEMGEADDSKRDSKEKFSTISRVVCPTFLFFRLYSINTMKVLFRFLNRTAAEINEWWKTTPHYKPDDAPVTNV